MTYLITFSCYGCHLHGHESGSVDKQHNLPGSPVLEASQLRIAVQRERMDQPPYAMDETRRDAVLAAIVHRCSENNWILLAAHVRTSHVHVVVEAETRPERIMNDLKSYASRCMNQLGLDHPARKRWTRHGSTRWLWKAADVSAAIRYVVEEQGERMAAFEWMEY